MEYVKGVHNLNLNVNLPYIFPLVQLNYSRDSITCIQVDSPLKPVPVFPDSSSLPPSISSFFLSIISSLQYYIYMKRRTTPCIFILLQVYLDTTTSFFPHFMEFPEASTWNSKDCKMLWKLVVLISQITRSHYLWLYF